MLKQQILNVFPIEIQKILDVLTDAQYEWLNEIRIRADKPILVIYKNKEYGLNEKGLTRLVNSTIITATQLKLIVQCMSKYSLYSLENEIRQGYFTLEGGHRVGIIGETVVENGRIKTLSFINALNFRIAHEIIGCSDHLMRYIVNKETGKVAHTLIISPPKCGKTTLIRDISRNLSNGYANFPTYTVGIVDERSEIAGCYQGVPQNDVGVRTDVFDKCPKAEGMKILVRCMAPQVIIVDEIGKLEDIDGLEEALCTGVTILCTVHGYSIEDCLQKPVLSKILNAKMFDRIIVLSLENGLGKVSGIYDIQDLEKNIYRGDSRNE